MKRLALLAALAATPALADPYDIPWFIQNPDARRATLEECIRDVAKARTRICQNASRAAASELGEPLPPASAGPHDPWERFLPKIAPSPLPAQTPNPRRLPRAT